MIDFSITLLHGFIICLPFSVFVIITFWLRPRLWLHSLPPDIIEKAEPKTEIENSITRSLLLPLYILILPGLSVASVFYLHETTSINYSFIDILIHIYSIWIVVHLWDFLILDCGATLLIDPQRPPISGTEGAKGWRDYKFHFRAFIRATIMSALFVVPIALILYLAL